MGLSYVVETATNKTFFTYFSEFDKAWEEGAVLIITLLGVLFVASVAGNLLVISFFLRYKAFRQVTNLFITNLAVSDLLFSSTIPLVMTTRATGDWIFGEILCHSLAAVEIFSGVVSVWTLVLISADRHRAIVRLRTSHRRPLRGTLVRVGLVWAGALLFTCPIAVYFTTVRAAIGVGVDRRPVTVCSLDFPGPEYTALIYSCVNIVVVFVVPLTVITRNYRAIMRRFASSLQRMRDHSVAGPGSRCPGKSARAAAKVQRERRVMTMLVAMVSLFVVFWGPVTMFLVALMADYRRRGIHSYQLTAVFTFTYASTALNPVVYGILNEQYRSHFRRLFGRLGCRKPAGASPAGESDGTERGGSRQKAAVRTVSGRRNLGEGLGPSGRDNGGCFDAVGNPCEETPT